MTDRYRLTEPTDVPPTPGSAMASPRQTSDLTDVLLWVVLALAIGANVALSAVGLDLLGIPAGLVVLGTGAALTVRHLKRRK